MTTASSSTCHKSSFPPPAIEPITSLRLHKEKKKLTTKVETLTRKVQTLQVKLAALRDATSNQNQAQPTASTSKPSSLPKEPVAVAPVRRTTLSPPPSTVKPSSPSRSRARSGPSALSRSRTPDRGSVPSVFRANLPEPARVSASRLHEPLSTAIVAGKKRSAPDDGDEAVPVQGFTSEGVLATGLNTATTPRRRKSPRTGFTPVRNTTSHPLTTLASEDAAQPTAVPIISDVTNSPRGKPAGDVKAKGSWLGAHKSRSTQSGNNATARTTSARPGAAVR
jgi:hypothetical protein